MPIKTLYVLRHGQTEFNVAGRLQGRLDSPLTAQGIVQAQAMGQRLAACIDAAHDWALFSSPLGRAQATASLVSMTLGLQSVTVDERLSEVAFCEWEGLDDSALKAGWPTLYGRGARSDWLFAAPQGEPQAQAFARARQWLSDPSLPEHVIVVSHGLFGQLLRGAFLGLSEADTLALDRPHGTVFRLHAGEMTRFDCMPAHA